MHMDVKQPAKLGVRFNWCKCLWGGSPVPTALAVLWSEHCAKAPGVRDSKARGTAPLVTSMQQQRVKPGPVTSRQCFGDTDMPFTATAPSMMEHSSPLDLKARKISSLAIPPGHFTDGDREVGRWGRQPHSAARAKNKLVSLHTAVQLFAHAASTYKWLLISTNNMVLFACSFPCRCNTQEGPAEVQCHIAQCFPLSAATPESEPQSPLGSLFILLPHTFSLAVS